MEKTNYNSCFSFTCSSRGQITEVLKKGAVNPDAGKYFSALFLSREKADAFLKEVKAHGYAKEWELNVEKIDEVITTLVSGAFFNGAVYILGAGSSSQLKAFYELIISFDFSFSAQFEIAFADAFKNQDEERRIKKDAYEEIFVMYNEMTILQRMLLKKNYELKKLHEQKNKLLGIAAHDLRNPLNIIKGYSEFLLEEAACFLPEKYNRMVVKIYESSDYMHDLVEMLLDYHVMETGELVLDIEPADIIRLIENKVEMNRVIAGKHNIDIHLVYGNQVSNIPENIYIDIRKTEQVLDNLITNAVKYTYPNTIIDVVIENKSDDIVITIKDHGPGIPENKLNDIFIPYRLAGSIGRDGKKGTGLGLAIVKNIVEAHAGNIHVESAPGMGSAFVVSLPIRVSA